MAIGDELISINSVAAGAFLDFVPTAGDEYIIFGMSSTRWIGVAPNAAYNMYADLRGAANTSIATAASNPSYWTDLKVIVSNSNRLRIQNPGGAGAIIGYWGFQTLD